MRGGTIILALGLLIGYLAISNRYKCFGNFFSCIAGEDCECKTNSTSKPIANFDNLTQPFQRFVTLPDIKPFNV